MLMMKTMEDAKLKSLVDSLNAKHYVDIVDSLDNPLSSYNQQMDELRARQVSQSAWTGNNKKGMRLLAVLTPEQDHAFSRVYGANYHRDPNFFKREFPQTLALSKGDL